MQISEEIVFLLKITKKKQNLYLHFTCSLLVFQHIHLSVKINHTLIKFIYINRLKYFVNKNLRFSKFIIVIETTSKR